MTTKKLNELKAVLETFTYREREGIRKIVNCGFGNSPDKLRDHFKYLYAGPIGQMFDSRTYKQLVTDVANSVLINWTSLLGDRHWEDLSAPEIEKAVMIQVQQHPETLNPLSPRWALLTAGVVAIGITRNSRMPKPIATAAVPTAAVAVA